MHARSRTQYAVDHCTVLRGHACYSTQYTADFLALKVPFLNLKSVVESADGVLPTSLFSLLVLTILLGMLTLKCCNAGWRVQMWCQ